MLGAFPVPVCAQDGSLARIKQADVSISLIQTDGRAHLGIQGLRNADASRDALRQRAEAAASEAAALRQKQTEKGFYQAIAKLRKSLRFFSAASLNDKAADSSLQIGEIYFTLSRYDKALSYYHEAIHLGGKAPDLLCVALSRVARTYSTTGQKSQAIFFSDQALQQCSPLADARLQAEALEARGEMLWNFGKPQESAEIFRRAQEVFEKAQDQNGQARALLMRAYSNDRAKALQFSREALQLWRSTGNRHGIAEVHNELGFLAATTGEFETARCNYEKSLPVFHDMGDKDGEASALNGLAYSARTIGNLDVSLENYRRAKAIYASVQDRLGTVEALTGMAKTLAAARQYRQMLSLYKVKLRLARQTRNAAQEASALEDMGDVYELQHQYATAEKFYARALAAYRAVKLDHGVGDALIRLARLYMRQHRYSQALSLLEMAHALKEKTGQVEDIAEISYELASIYRRVNRLEDARAAIEKNIAIIESERLKISSFDSRAAYFSSVHKYYALYIQILMLLHQQAPEQGFAHLAFDASEKSKVRALLDLLSASKQDSPCDKLLQRQLAPSNLTEASIEDVDPAVSGAPVLTLKEIQSEIGSDDTVLEYVLGDEKSYVWLVDANQIIAYELPPADKIGKLIHEFLEPLTAREPRPGENNLDEYQHRVARADAAYPVVAWQLSQLLLGPLNLEGAKRLLIVPDGLLQYIPFSALSLPQADDKNTALISQHEVVMLPSVAALGTLRRAESKKAPPTHGAIVFADPVVERDDPRVAPVRSDGKKKPQVQSPTLKIALRDAQGPQRVARLMGSRTEAEIIQKVLGAQDAHVALDFAASRDSVLGGALDGYRLIHFATHGIIDARHPEMSGLVLSLVNERGQPQDGYLRLGDIYKLNLSADLVVLSACNSAMGKDLASEGIIGLPRGFLYAGARSVIASLWKVNDEAAADFMRGFYARIQSGASPSSALRGAQLEMSRGHNWHEPFYWAAFVLQGDYK